MLKSIDLSQVMVIDIETVPQYPSYHDVPANLQDLWEQKTHYQRSADQSAEEFYEKAGIMAEFGKIICISMGIFSYQNKKYSLRLKSISGDDEKDLLQKFYKLLDKQAPSLVFCAHNGKEFDYPYLCRRFLVNGISIPTQLEISGKKPWEVRHLDTMELWKFGDYKHYTSLNLLATILNIPTPKDDIDGSQVRQVYYEEQNLERIITYCQKDVITTAQVLLKFKGLEIIPTENITIVA
ncbi:3'-5' exonuclease [Pedobacter changchengzhani]|uniref:3'-5' exonuclease n=1 Tax=Pedobacter changchengzhani TaxID=2529274 RepID=A0A4R5MKS0_9SPHI|nr:3'-5' exonuclease [Pedobacter changchengzhani]TDG35689.1 3'-5' exonuclease [Pedobacter changchengzhani]